MWIYADVNAAADAVFDSDIKIKDKRLFLRDLEARAILKASAEWIHQSGHLQSLVAEPSSLHEGQNSRISQIWPANGQRIVRARSSCSCNANALGPKPGPPTAIFAKTFDVTASEAKLTCVYTRRASANCCPRTGNSVGDSRNRLKSVLPRPTPIAKANSWRYFSRSSDGFAL